MLCALHLSSQVCAAPELSRPHAHGGVDLWTVRISACTFMNIHICSLVVHICSLVVVMLALVIIIVAMCRVILSCLMFLRIFSVLPVVL